MKHNQRLKIAITGTSRGLGKCILETLSESHDCIKTTARIENYEMILSSINDCDVFINNACSEHNQLQLLNYIYQEWRELNKLIINIGSRAGNPNISKGFLYSTYKNALLHYSSLVTFKDRNKKCRITTINPGLLNADKKYSLKYEDVINSINYVLSIDDTIEISRIDLHSCEPYELVQDYKSMTRGKWKF